MSSSSSPSSSSVPLEDALYQQARGVYGRDFEEWVGKVRAMLQVSERGPSCLTLLRQLYVLIAATKYSRNLSLELHRLLRSVVLEPEQGSPRIRLLASAILRELSPSSSIVVKDFNPPVEKANIPYVLPVLLAQTNARERLSQLAPDIIKILTQPGYEEDVCLASFACLHALCSHGHALERLTEDGLRSLSMQLAHWLRTASRNCLQLPSGGINLFGGSSKRQLLAVKEVDGTPSQDIFTVLSIGGFYSYDQLLNVHVFSFLRRWLLTTLTTSTAGPSPSLLATPTSELRGQVSPSPVQDRRSSRPPSITPLQFTSSVPSPLSSSSSTAAAAAGGSPLTASLITPSHTSGAGRSRQGLKDVTVQYCLRVIEQCERKPIKSTDEELMTACLYECVSLLDILCSVSRSLTHGVFPTMKKLYARFAQDPLPNARLLLPLLRFFVNHGESEMYDSETSINLFFGEVLSAKFSDPGVAYDTVHYLVENMETLHNKTNIFTKYFPNLLKILAWSPVTFLSEYLQLLPVMITPASSSEVLHSLLDLPCLTATLQAQHLINAVPNLVELNLLPRYAKCFAAFQDSSHRLMFRHFLRSENGKGDTIDKLGVLHMLLEDFSGHQRVIAAAQITPLLLRLFFKTLFHGADSNLLSQHLTVQAERITLLYQTGSFQTEVREVIADQLLEIVRLFPRLLVDHSRDVLDYLGNLWNLSAGGEHCYTHLVWLLGEYSHTGYDARCTTAMLNQYFETLELSAYEIALGLHRQSEHTTRLILVLMSSVAKIASRCQDLIPRALLCLNKIVQLGSDSSSDPTTPKVLLSRANELVNVLKIPSVASAVLSPPPPPTPAAERGGGGGGGGGGALEVQRQTKMAHLLQSTSSYLQQHTPS